MKGRVLIIDSNPDDSDELGNELVGAGYEVLTEPSSASAVGAAEAFAPIAIITDPFADGVDPFILLQELRARQPHTPIILTARDRSIETAMRAIQEEGAYHYFEKPVDPEKFLVVLERAVELAETRRENEILRRQLRDRGAFGELVGNSETMQQVYMLIEQVASSSASVLITGESGTGKELVARTIHNLSPRRNAPFLAINCAAIPETLLESELFGHEKGAFTGADRRRIGKFEQCNGGTLFLDEIGDMPPATQAKMLRVLQEQAFERVGGNETIRTDVRLIAATHRDLKAWSEEGKFRPDLYYRLGVFTIHLPPLRERDDDLLMLVQYYLRRFNRELGREVREVTPEGLERLRGYPWPGNVRELQSVLKQALLKASGPVLLPAFLPEPLGETGAAASPAPPLAAEPGVETFVIRQRVGSDVRDLYAETHRQVDRLLLPRVLEHTRGNLQQAALLLGIARQTLRLKLRDLGLSVARPGEAEEDDPV